MDLWKEQKQGRDEKLKNITKLQYDGDLALASNAMHLHP